MKGQEATQEGESHPGAGVRHMRGAGMSSIRRIRSLATGGLAVLMLTACGNSGSQPASSEGSPTTAPETAAEPEESPEVADARLEGTWTVEVEVVEAKNLLDRAVGDTFTREYVFTPTCPEGPCDTEVEREAAQGVETETLTFADGVYTFSSEEEPFQAPACQNETIFSQFSYEIRVTSAEEIDGEWRAVAFTGELTSASRTSPEARAAGCAKRATERDVFLGTLES
jgi:hypothetical protein